MTVDVPFLKATVVLGEIPRDLRGTYYKSGPMLFTHGAAQRGNPNKTYQKRRPPPPPADVAHPFEGDGGIFAVTFGDVVAEEEEEEQEEEEGRQAADAAAADDDDGYGDDGGDDINDSDEAVVTFRSRHVRTAAFLNERKRGGKLYASMDRLRDVGAREICKSANDFPVPLVKMHMKEGLNRKRRNTSNSNVVYWGGKLLSLWDGGLPYKIDALSLSTAGKSRLGSALKADASFSSASRFMPTAKGGGRMIFYDAERGQKATKLKVYEFDNSFKLAKAPKDLDRENSFSLFSDPEPSEYQIDSHLMFSDIAVTSSYYVISSPVVEVEAVQYLLTMDPSRCMKIDDDRAGYFYLLPRSSAAVSSLGSDPVKVKIPDDGLGNCGGLTYSNAYENAEGEVVVQAVRSIPTGDMDQNFKMKRPWGETISDHRKISTKKELWSYTINPQTNSCVSASRVTDLHLSLTKINRDKSGSYNRYTFGNCGGMGSEVSPFQGICKLEISEGGKSTKSVEKWLPNEDEFAGEPEFVKKSNAVNEDDGYIITTLQRGASDSEIVILDAREISKGPMCRIRIDGVRLPHCYRGSWADGLTPEPGQIMRRAKLADKLESKGNLFNEVKSDFSGLGLRLDDFDFYGF